MSSDTSAIQILSDRVTALEKAIRDAQLNQTSSIYNGVSTHGDVKALGGIDIGTATGAGSGQLFTSDIIESIGSNGGLFYRDRNGTALWGLYATSNITRIWNGTTDVITVTTGGGMTVTGGFGANGKSAQTSVASGGALAAYGAGTNGFDTAAHASALYALVVAIRTALVANGIMS